MLYGYEVGEICGRDRCNGIIALRPVENCSCHIAAPCSQCVDSKKYCPTCGYDSANDFQMNGYILNKIKPCMELRKLDATKIDYRIKGHSSSSQMCEGVYPEGTTREEIEQRVKGTFGGRFDQFGNGKFVYIAYTD